MIGAIGKKKKSEVTEGAHCRQESLPRRRVRVAGLKKMESRSSPSHKEVEGTRVALRDYGIVIRGYAVFSLERFCFKRSWNISSYSSADGAVMIPTPL